MKEILTSSGDRIQVDDCDYEWLSGLSWSVDRHGPRSYAETSIRLFGKTVTFTMHNMILNPPVKRVADHVDGNGLNNKRSNLRIATYRENTWNARPYKTGKATSKYKGVYKEKCRGQKGGKVWRAALKSCGKRLYLGRFHTEEEAARAYDEVAKKHYGEFAYLNFPS